MNNMKKMICALTLLLGVSTAQQANALITDLLKLGVIGGIVYYVYKYHYLPKQQAAQNVSTNQAPATQGAPSTTQAESSQSPVASTQPSTVSAVQAQATEMVQIQLPSEAQVIAGVQQFIQAAETVVENVEEIVQELQTEQQVSHETSMPPVQEEVAA